MSDLLWRYWGKADPTIGGHHAMVLHSLDVAACAHALVDADNVLLAKLTKLLNIEPSQAAPTIAFLAALHDIGKLDARFQVKAPEVAEKLQPGLPATVTRTRYDHGAEGFLQVVYDHGEEVVALLGSGGSALLAAVCGHHGQIPAGYEPAGRDYRPSIERQDKQARLDFLKSMIALFGSRGAVTSFDVEDTRAVQLLAGVCAVADWVGSNPQWFPYETGPLDLSSAWDARVERGRTSVAAAGLVPLPPSGYSFEELFPGYAPRDVQLLTEALSADEPALLIIEAEMGKGKTEAALSWASRQMASGGATGVYAALPTMATSNAMLRRIEELAPRLVVSSDSAPVQLALAHGRARRQPLFRKLVQRALIARDADAPEAGPVCARWLLSKKRALLAQVGVGTVDQAMHSVLRVNHQFVRIAALARDVVVIDEIHAYDSYMEAILEHVVHWLGALDVPVVLLSATLTSERRARLVRCWQGATPVGGHSSAGEAEASATSAEDASGAPYPLVTLAKRNATTTHHLPPALQPTPRSVSVEARFTSPTMEATAALLVDAARQGARVGWINNTVAEAQDAYRAVLKARVASTSEVEAALFHARFRGRDRQQIETSVLDRYGKGSATGGRVLVATQVIEQSLDLDFDLLVTALCPIDLLFQRLGRVHRHPRARPQGFETPRVVVVGPSDVDAAGLRFGPSVFVYDAATLWISRELLRQRSELILPTDIRPMVEASYHPDLRTSFIQSGPKGLEAKESRRTDEVTAREAHARQLLIAAADGSVVGSTVSDDDETLQALTRDGQSSTIVPVAWDGEEGTSLDGDLWDLRPEADGAWRTTDALIDETISFPSQTAVRGVLAQGEVAAWDAWNGRFRAFIEQSGLGRVEAVPMRRVNAPDQGETAWRGWLLRGTRRSRVMYSASRGLVFVKERQGET